MKCRTVLSELTFKGLPEVTVSCTVNDKIYAVPAETMVHTSGVEQGRQMLERAAEVIHEMQNCSFRVDF